MKDFIYQVDEKECGYAVIKMLLASVNKNENFLYLPRFNNTNEAYSLFELIAFAKKYQLLLSAYQIKGINALLNERAPFIYIKTLPDNSFHAILIKKKWRYFSYVYDPAIGKKIMLNKKVFNDSEIGANILNVEAVQLTSLNLIAPKLIANKDQSIILLLNIISLSCFFFSAYFINDNDFMFLPIFLIAVGVIIAIIHRVFIYKAMQKFDDNFIAYTFSNDKAIREDNYRLMHKVKASLFTSYSRLIISLFTALAINLILILKDKRAIVVLLISLIMALIDNFLITPIAKKKSEEIVRKERELLSEAKKSQEDYINEYNEIKEATYSVTKRLDYKRIIIYFCLLMVVFIMSYLVHEMNVYFILFYMMTSIFSYDNFINAFKISDENKENTINQTKFKHLIIKNDKNHLV